MNALVSLMRRARPRGLPMLFVLGLAMTLPLRASAETVAFRSGTAPCEACTATSHCVGLGSPAPAEITPDRFAAAASGPAPIVISSPVNTWLDALPGDPLAQWVNETGSAGSGGNVLYALTFDLEAPFTRASLSLEFAVDNLVGYSRSSSTPGVYLNGHGLPSSIGGDYRAATSWHWSEVSGLLHPGRNTLYLYVRDLGVAAGVIFTGHLDTAEDGAPLTADIEGFPVIRAGEPSSYTLRLRNHTATTIPLAYICVSFSAPGVVVHTSRSPDPVPWAYTAPESPSFTAHDDDHAYLHFFVANLPPGADAGFPFDLEARLPLGARAGAVATKVLVLPFGVTSGAKAGTFLGPNEFQCILNLAMSTVGHSMSDLIPYLECAVAASVGVGAAIGTALDRLGASGMDYFTPQQMFYDFFVEWAAPCAMSAGVGRAMFARGVWRALGWPLAIAGTACLAYEFYQACGAMETQYTSCYDLVIGLVSSLDPNVLIGVGSAGSPSFTFAGDQISYLARFENAAEASAPAKLVVLESQIDAVCHELDSVTLQSLDIGRHHYDLRGVPVGARIDFDLRPDADVAVRFESSWATAEGPLRFRMTALDPTTLTPISNPLGGFLPPNLTHPEGEGAVRYTARVRGGAQSGATTSSLVAITFDTNPAIETNVVAMLIDNEPPTIAAAIQGIDETRGQATLSYEARDDASGVSRVILNIAIGTESAATTNLAPPIGTFAISQATERRHEYAVYCEDAAGHRSDVMVVGALQFAPTPRPRMLRATPNPARGATYFEITGFANHNVAVEILDLAGRRVGWMPERQIEMDRQFLPWHNEGGFGRSLAAGVYVVRVIADDGSVSTNKLVLLK